MRGHGSKQPFDFLGRASVGRDGRSIPLLGLAANGGAEHETDRRDLRSICARLRGIFFTLGLPCRQRPVRSHCSTPNGFLANMLPTALSPTWWA